MYGYAYMYKRQCRDIQESLRKMGFEPIEIGGNYFYNINFLNAIAFRTKNGGISYITNSVRDSGPEWNGLEEIFENDLRASVDNIEMFTLFPVEMPEKTAFLILTDPMSTQ